MAELAGHSDSVQTDSCTDKLFHLTERWVGRFTYRQSHGLGTGEQTNAGTNRHFFTLIGCVIFASRIEKQIIFLLKAEHNEDDADVERLHADIDVPWSQFIKTCFLPH